jgi:SAM-dependent methyltransferase
MSGRFIVDRPRETLLPGNVADYLSTPMIDGNLAALGQERAVMLRALEDRIPLPTTEAREGYFGDRHFEFWLSGERDAMKVLAACNDSLDSAPGRRPRLLDFGGASGRVIRHFPALRPDLDLYLCDTNTAHVDLVRHCLENRVKAFHNVREPHLPLPDGYLDVVCAFSVFTHIYEFDIAWLLELRRVVRPGGKLYLTIHDEHTWWILKDIFLADLCFSNEDFRNYREANHALSERVVHFYNDENNYNCNVFTPQHYIESAWKPHFVEYAHYRLAHDHQSAVVLTVG